MKTRTMFPQKTGKRSAQVTVYLDMSSKSFIKN